MIPIPSPSYGGGAASEFSQSVLLIQPTAASGSIVDISNNENVVTVNGGTALSTAVTDPAGGSAKVIDFTSAGDLTLPSIVQVGKADLAIRLKFRLVSVSGNQVLMEGNVSAFTELQPQIFVNSSGKVLLYTNNGFRITGGTTLTGGVWYDLLWSRVAGTSRLFIDGVQEGSDYADTVAYHFRPLFGKAFDGTSSFGGYMQSIQIVPLNGLHAAAFTPPTFPLATS